jgi:hypothetical protein
LDIELSQKLSAIALSDAHAHEISERLLLPISPKYFGKSCAVALTTVTSGAGMAGAAACTLHRLQSRQQQRRRKSKPPVSKI